jgi:hypothetical protein
MSIKHIIFPCEKIELINFEFFTSINNIYL